MATSVGAEEGETSRGRFVSYSDHCLPAPRDKQTLLPGSVSKPSQLAEVL